MEPDIIYQVVRGDRAWHELGAHGITAQVSGDRAAVFAPDAEPVAASAQDVAKGWPRHSDDSWSLRDWARFRSWCRRLG